MKSSLQINGDTFTQVKVQREGESSVYQCANVFLRLGKKERILKELAIHRQMEEAGFPVARVLEVGEYDGYSYFTETSLGTLFYSKLFAQDIERYGRIGDERFASFLNIMKQFVRAQLKTLTEVRDEQAFSEKVHLPILLEEMPDLAPRIEARYTDTMDKLSIFPFCLTHGDCNPHNLYPAGIIDLEDTSFGPIGYDAVCAIVHIDYFPTVPGYEYVASYHFTDGQKKQYLDEMDALFVDAGLSPVSQYRDEFEFYRAIWLLVRMHKWPKIQQFRYDLFRKKFFST